MKEIVWSMAGLRGRTFALWMLISVINGLLIGKALGEGAAWASLAYSIIVGTLVTMVRNDGKRRR